MITKETDKIQPYSEEAERGVIGSIMMDAERVLNICRDFNITADSFYVPAHQALFNTMLAMNPHHVDLLTLGEELSQKGTLDKVGGHSFIERIVDETPTAAHAEYYIKIVSDRAVARRVLRTNEEISNRIYDGQPIEEVIMDIHKSLDFIHQHKQKKDEAFHEIGLRVLNEWEHPEARTGVITRWAGLTRTIGNMPDGALVYVSARPSMGKTTLMTNQAAFNITSNIPTGVVTLELTRDRLVRRMIGELGGIPTFQLGLGGSPNLLAKARATVDMFKGLPLYIADWSMDAGQLYAWAHSEKRRHGIKMLMLDRIELLKAPRGISESDLTAKTSINSTLLQQLAKELDIPVVVLTQLNRQCEIEKREPELYDMRQSGSLEQDATIVLMLCLDERDPTLTWLKVVKSQDTMTGRIPMRFIKDVNRLVEDMDYYKST